jgi:hypothetical protein
MRPFILTNTVDFPEYFITQVGLFLDRGQIFPLLLEYDLSIDGSQEITINDINMTSMKMLHIKKACTSRPRYLM